MRNHSRSAVRRNQRGAILVVSLLLLLVMTLLAVVTMRAGTLEERMAGNARDANLSFQSSEAGARAGEGMLGLEVMRERPETCGTIGDCLVLEKGTLEASEVDLRSQPASWWADRAEPYSTEGGHDIGKVVEDPRFLIEQIGFLPDSLRVGDGVPAGRTYFRITARAVGGTEVAQTIVQTTYTRRF
jgi:type IV pilus assembly protein PilX